MKCYELIDKIASSLATFAVLISLTLNDDSVIDAKEFHKLQTLYLRGYNVDRKMKVQTKENFQKNYSGPNKKSKKRHGTKIVGLSFCMLFNCLYYKNNEE